MLCPESPDVVLVQNETKEEEETVRRNKTRKVPVEGTISLELNSYKNPKTWKKSITNFFRHSLRSTRSNDGDEPSGSNNNFGEKDISPDQKWQSLGKMFRRQSLAEHWSKSSSQGESSSQNKRLAVKKVLSSYFGKAQKSLPVADEK